MVQDHVHSPQLPHTPQPHVSAPASVGQLSHVSGGGDGGGGDGDGGLGGGGLGDGGGGDGEGGGGGGEGEGKTGVWPQAPAQQVANVTSAPSLQSPEAKFIVRTGHPQLAVVGVVLPPQSPLPQPVEHSMITFMSLLLCLNDLEANVRILLLAYPIFTSKRSSKPILQKPFSPISLQPGPTSMHSPLAPTLPSLPVASNL